MREDPAQDSFRSVRAAGGGGDISLPPFVEEGVRAAGGRIEIRRLRQAVAPDGALTEDMDVASLEVVDAAMIEAEGREAGLEPVSRRTIRPTISSSTPGASWTR